MTVPEMIKCLHCGGQVEKKHEKGFKVRHKRCDEKESKPVVVYDEIYWKGLEWLNSLENESEKPLSELNEKPEK